MSFTFKILKAGGITAGSEAQTVYTVASPASAAIVSNLRFYNAGASSANVTIAVKESSGTAIKMGSVVVVSEGSLLWAKELTLALGQAVQLTVDQPVDCLISGVERV